MAWYKATVSTDGSGDGTNLTNGRPVWSGNFYGFLMGVRLDFSGSAAAGSDTTLTEINGLQRTLVSLTDTNTDTTLNPQIEITDNAGTGKASYSPAIVDSANLKVTVAQGGATVTDHVAVFVEILEVEA